MNHLRARSGPDGFIRHLASCFEIIAEQIVRSHQAFANIVESFSRIVGRKGGGGIVDELTSGTKELVELAKKGPR